MFGTIALNKKALREIIETLLSNSLATHEDVNRLKIKINAW